MALMRRPDYRRDAGRQLTGRHGLFRMAPMIAWLVFGAVSPALSAADETTGKVDKLFAAWDKTTSPGASLAVIRDGKILYERGYGMAKLEDGIVNTPEKVFDIGSVSKQFTAACVAMLVREGKVEKVSLTEREVRGTLKPGALAPGMRHGDSATPIERMNVKAVPAKYYAVAIVFILFDLETVFLFIWALGAQPLTGFMLFTFFLFTFLLIVILLYVYRARLLEAVTE